MKTRYDKPIPLGWFAVEYADKLAVSEVKPLYYFGRDLVLFRTESGTVKLLDAHCPHLGAHIGHGGKVEGECVSCPFHAWKFDGAGFCTDVPYASRIPPKADGKQVIRSYPVVERNGMIWAWYHPQDEAPGFDVFQIPEFLSPEWTDIESYDWTFNCIIQETGENAADIAHFVTVHGNAGMPLADVSMDGHQRATLMVAQAPAMNAEGHVDHSGEQFETGRLESYNYGPGLSYQKFTRMFDIVMMGALTPIDDQTMRMHFCFSMPKAQSGDHALYAQGFRDEIVHQVEQDIPIWENKVYRDQPILCDGDGPIAQYRKWFSQFYVAQ